MRFSVVCVILVSVISASSYGNIEIVQGGGGDILNASGAYGNIDAPSNIEWSPLPPSAYSRKAFGQAVTYTNQVPVTIQAFNPAYGTLISINVSAVLTASMTWTYQWGLNDECIGSGLEGIDGGTASAYGTVVLPGFSLTAGSSANIPENHAYDLSTNIPDIPVVTGVFGWNESGGSNFDNGGSYVGIGAVTGAYLVTQCSMVLYCNEPVESTVAIAQLTGIMSANVSVIYTYEDVNGTTQSMSQLINVTSVPEVTTLLYMSLAMIIPIYRKRS